jgi:predicted nucleic acid-binding protein
LNILDASTLINLINGEALDLVLRLEGFRFSVGPIVLAECGSHQEQLRELVAAGLINALDEDAIPATQFLVLSERYGLGYGETECLAFATTTDVVICCDDGAARDAIAELIGSNRLSGSLGLLREAVRQRRVTAKGAFAIYEQMRAKGAFLPEVAEEFFADISDTNCS